MWFLEKQRHSSHPLELGHLNKKKSNIIARVSPQIKGHLQVSWLV